jgi:hypothetical protein
LNSWSSGIYFLKHGQREGKSLAGSSMSLADEVSALQKGRDSCGLYWKWLTDPHFPHCLEQWKFQAKTFEPSSHESSPSSAQRPIKTLQTVHRAKLSVVKDF